MSSKQTPLPSRIEAQYTTAVGSSKEIFIGIVQDVVHKESTLLKPIRDAYEQFPEEMNNRHMLLVSAISGNHPAVSEQAWYINSSHEMDMPISGESVLCVRTEYGVIVISRLGQYGYGMNYDPKDGTLATSADPSQEGRSNFSGVDIDYGKHTKKKNLKEVRPFYYKPASYNIAGRDNQYFIMDTRERWEPSGNEKEWTKNGTFIKMGMKKGGNQVEHRMDTTKTTMTIEAKIQPMMEQEPFSVRNPKIPDQSWNGAGMESDDLYFSSRTYNVSYSGYEILENAGSNYYVDAPRFSEHESRRIHLGRFANQPVVLGWEYIKMWEEFARATVTIIPADLYQMPGCVAFVPPTPVVSGVGAPIGTTTPVTAPTNCGLSGCGVHTWCGAWPSFVQQFLRKWCEPPYPPLSFRTWVDRGTGPHTPNPDLGSPVFTHRNYTSYSTLF